MTWIWNALLVLGISLVISTISYFVFGIKGPWGSYWIKTLVLFLFLMVLSLWLKPTGPQWRGVQYLSLIISGLIFIFFVGSMPNMNDDHPKIPTHLSLMEKKRLMNEYRKDQSRLFYSVNLMFWIFLMLLLALIIAGYYFLE